MATQTIFEAKATGGHGIQPQPKPNRKRVVNKGANPAARQWWWTSRVLQEISNGKPPITKRGSSTIAKQDDRTSSSGIYCKGCLPREKRTTRCILLTTIA
eukprot:356500-Chlamydomonas_euryale.AAC.2